MKSIGDALTKSAVDAGMLDPDAPQHEVDAEEPPVHVASEYQVQRGRNAAFVTTLAREGFGDDGKPSKPILGFGPIKK